MIVIPMAGLSSRFFKAGYTRPKYQLPLGQETVFSWSVRTFEAYFKTDLFIFIYRDIYQTKEFLLEEIAKLGIDDYQLIELQAETQGQADTVFQGIHELPDSELFIFNIDSKVCHFTKPSWYPACDGYLEVFVGEGDHWSFALPSSGNRVLKTAEKERISDLCSDGLYYFRSSKRFCDLVQYSMEQALFVKGELYIAPLYNLLIEAGADIRYDQIVAENILFCGTPSEYQAILNDIAQ